MRINKVEELVGITKKNIRFYEEKGLLSPDRNSENGYREYCESDVLMLQKIKLLRQLSVPIEEIQKLQKGMLTLEDCMRRHVITLERDEKNIRQRIVMCSEIEETGQQFATMETDMFLNKMIEMEKEGVRFMDVKDVDKKRRESIIFTIGTVLLMCGLIYLFLWGYSVEPIPLPLLILFIFIPIFIIIGVILALKDRIRQIEGGEEDAASKY